MNPTLARFRWARLAVDNPVVFFYLLRFITWVVAVVMLASESAPDINRRFGEGLALYVLFHLVLGTVYASIIHPKIRGTSEPGRSPDLLIVGLLDMVASLVVVYYSGGWGSPFWHFAVTSILVPCFLVTFTWTFVITSFYVALYVVTVLLGGDGLDGTWMGSQRHMFVGFIFTAYLVGLAVTYLGHIFRALDAEKGRSNVALDDLETLYQVTRNVIAESVDVHNLVQQVTQTVRGRLQFDQFSIYLWQPEDRVLRLTTSTVGLEEVGERLLVEQGEGLVGKAASSGKAQVADVDRNTWTVAVPLRAGEDLLGAILVVIHGKNDERERLMGLCQALANQISIGIHNSRLYTRQLELVAEEERIRIARDIHDGVAQSMYALSLSLETCAEIADREDGPLKERLRKLVPLAKNTLLETRHYIYDLKPLLSGESDLTAVAENQVKEFRMVAGTPTELSVEGEPAEVHFAAATGFYRILQEALSNVLKHARASKVGVSLRFEPDRVILTVEDDGDGFDIDNANSGYGLDNMRKRATELNGSVDISSTVGRGTVLRVTLPTKGG